MGNINETENHEALAQRLIAEEMARHAMRPVKARHALATPGSKTRMGGEVVTASAEFDRWFISFPLLTIWVAYYWLKKTELRREAI